MAAPVEPAPDPAGDLGADGLPVWFPDDDPWQEFDERLTDEEFAALCVEEEQLVTLCSSEPDPGPSAAGCDGSAPDWSIPGLEPESDRDGLSVASSTALAETAAAVQALRLAHARAYRALQGLQASDAVTETGYRSVTRLLEDHVRIDPSEALRLTRHAASLATTVSPTGSPEPADLPATAALVEAGTIGPGHVEVIRKTLHRLDAVVPALADEVLATTETQLAELATTHAPAALAKAAGAILALLDPDGTAPDDDPPPENELHYLRRKDGTLAGRFAYRDPAAAEFLATALAHATPPPEGAALEDQPERGRTDGPERGESPDSQALRTLPERRAQALLDLAGEAYQRGVDTTSPEATPSAGDPAGAEETTGWGLFDPDTDPDADAPKPEPGTPAGAPPAWSRADSEGGERVALTLTVDLETLRRQLREATPPPDGTLKLGLLGENTYIRPETARRLACDADLVPAVMGGEGQPLDLGRKVRIVPPHVRRALYLRDRHCAHPGCRRRARKTHAHHILHWVDGGETCPENCVLLCAYHHSLVHHSGWEIVMIDGMPWFRPPRWLDPAQRLRHNRPWQTVRA
ncbi:HNH endonuclease signature motif containing protein [Actinomycetospora atypica]|uniref:DUF222 domain-containing protein n=1 Tax=Actinomycetospora atypica TaxID=1290095 RepID=A0ABV9YIX1_9PSEU